METATGEDVAALSYEQARDELVRVVAELEQGSATLESSLALWERGERLAQRCEEWLIGAKARLDAARLDAAQRDAAQRGPTQHESTQHESTQSAAAN